MQNTEFNRLKLKTDQLYLPLSGGKVNGETTFAKKVTFGSGDKAIKIHDGIIEGIRAEIIEVAESSDVDTADNITTFTSSDTTDADANAWTSVTRLLSGENHKSIFAKVSQMFKNIRYLYKILGTTDISSIGDGTVTGGIDTLNQNLNEIDEPDLTTYTTPAIFQNRVKNVSGGYKQVDKTVYINVTFDTNVELGTSSWALLGTVPIPKNNDIAPLISASSSSAKDSIIGCNALVQGNGYIAVYPIRTHPVDSHVVIKGVYTIA